MDPSFWALDLDAPSTVRAEVTDYDPVKHGLTYPRHQNHLRVSRPQGAWPGQARLA